MHVPECLDLGLVKTKSTKTCLMLQEIKEPKPVIISPVNFTGYFQCLTAWFAAITQAEHFGTFLMTAVL